MRPFSNANPKDLRQAAALARQTRAEGRTPALVGGGSDLLALVKDRVVAPDVLINLKATSGTDRIAVAGNGATLGGLATLNTIAQHSGIRQQFTVLAEAAETVATPQIRNVGTLAGNVCQRPWCWYYRNGFPCLKNGGTNCFSITGENQFHAIFGGGPSYIVHPSDTAPALIALNASFRIVGPTGERLVPAAEFFTLPRENSERENILAADEVLAEIRLPRPGAGTRSTYHKVMDREAWTHAIVSAAMVLEMDGETCRNARIVLGGVAPIPWRLTEVEKMLAGQRVTPELAARAADAAVQGARPLSKNAYKIPMTRGVVERTLSSLVNPA